MKQVVQNYKTGKLELADVPIPACPSGYVLVRNVNSLLSAGTEKSMLEMAKKSLAGKALARPDLAKQVIAKARADGVLEAYRQAMNRLDVPVPLGYSSSGVVVEVGSEVKGIAKGDRVACTGSGFASHAEFIAVPRKLLTKIPDSVDFESAAFVALGGIALEAIRLAEVTLGMRVLIIGLGLLGQISVQLLRAGGCHVFGTDLVKERVQRAIDNGAADGCGFQQESLEDSIRAFAPEGVDAVLIMATTQSNQPLQVAANVTRERGCIVVAGRVGLEVPRSTFFEKELELKVSRAWGPGALDPGYVEVGTDYPIGYARWTAQRNIAEFLAQLEGEAVSVDHLVTHRFGIDRAVDAYELLLTGKEPYIGILIDYPTDNEDSTCSEKHLSVARTVRLHVSADKHDTVTVGSIGAGLFAKSTFFPLLRHESHVQLRGVATTSGVSSQHAARKFGFEYSTTDYKEILQDSKVQLVTVLTPPGTHAKFVAESLMAGKNVYVEKPLAVNRDQLQSIVRALRSSQEMGSPILFVGFNRRFAPLARWVKCKFAQVEEPLAVHCTINAGKPSSARWLYDRQRGGGRIIAEVCHFVDLIQYFTGSIPARIHAETLSSQKYDASDNVMITLRMANGSIASITYVAGGDKAFPRERIEVFGGGAVGVIENFRNARFVQGGRNQKKQSWLSLDRGHSSEVGALIAAIRNGEVAPVAFQEYVATTLTTFAIEESLRKQSPIVVDTIEFLTRAQSEETAEQEDVDGED